jgi:D-arabinose 5-phosphate isomerase GutQ
MNSYFENVIRTISDSLSSVDEGQYERLISECIGTTKSGHKIIASGLGKNVPICEKFVGTLNSVGIDACFLHTNSAMHGDIGMIKNDDLVLLLSKSGNTEETMMLARVLQKRKVKVWLLTFGEKPKVADLVSDVLKMKLDDEGDPWNIVPNNSSTIFLIVLQAVAVALINDCDIPLSVFKANHPGGFIGETLKNVKD